MKSFFQKTFSLVVILSILFVASPPQLALAAAGDIDPTFNAGGSGTNGSVFDVLYLAGAPEHIVIGGNFSSYNGSAVPADIIRLNSDGSLDGSFNSGGAGTSSGFVWNLAAYPGGKVLVSGTFTTYNGNAVAPNRIMRLNSDGTLDTTFNYDGIGGSTTWGANSDVNAMLVLPSGQIIIGGIFTSYTDKNGTHSGINRLARLDSDGTLDTTFSVGTGPNGAVWSLALDVNGNILVGGRFTTYNGIDCPNAIIRVDSNGGLDSAFNTGGAGLGGPSGFQAYVNTISVEPVTEKILIGGYFVSYNGDAATPDYLMQLLPTGALDSTFNTGNTGANAEVYKVVRQPADGYILVGGYQTMYNGLEAPDYVMRLNQNGAMVDPNFNPAPSIGANGFVNAIAIQTNNSILIGGGFTSYDGDTNVPDGIVRLDNVFVDNTPPDTTITSAPSNPANSANATFTFTGDDGSGSGIAGFECQLDNGGFTACTTPLTYSGLSDGIHTFEVRAVDLAGNKDTTPASYTWLIDTTQPGTTLVVLTVNPSSPVAAFTFTGNDGTGSGVASFECRLDGGVFAACTSQWNYTTLLPGSHTFEVRAVDAVGNLDATPASYTWIVKDPVFTDVSDQFTKKYIDSIFSFGISTGCAPDLFCPTWPTTRAQMSVMILKAVNGKDYTPPDVATVTFSDVPVTHWAHDYIEEFYAQGYTTGFADGTYRPDASVNRSQAAVFIVKGMYGVDYVPPPPPVPATFNDTPDDFFLPYIEKLVADGITAGCGGGNYCPYNSITRQQMAIFLVRAFDLPVAP